MDRKLSTLERSILLTAAGRRRDPLSIAEACVECVGLSDAEFAESANSAILADDDDLNSLEDEVLELGEPDPSHPAAGVYYRRMATVTQAFAVLVRMRLCCWRRAWIRGEAVGLAPGKAGKSAHAKRSAGRATFKPARSGIVLTRRGREVADAVAAEAPRRRTAMAARISA